MTLQETIKQKEQRFESDRLNLESLKTEIIMLKTKQEASASDLIKDFESGAGKFIRSKTRNSTYEFILGGDGRSQPWSEQRKGMVCEVAFISEIWASDESKQKLKIYIQQTKDFDHIVIKKLSV